MRHPDMFGSVVPVRRRTGGLTLMSGRIAFPERHGTFVLEVRHAILDLEDLPFNGEILVVEITIPGVVTTYDPDRFTGFNSGDSSKPLAECFSLPGSMLQLANQIVFGLLCSIEEMFENLAQEVQTSLLVFKTPFDHTFVSTVTHSQMTVLRVIAESVFAVFMQVPHGVENEEVRIPP